MAAGKRKNGNHANSLQSILDGINIQDLNGHNSMNEQIMNDDHDKNVKEVIRRLKIQNTKLLQQVSSLRKQVKQHGTGKKQVMDDADNLPKLEIRIEVLR